MGWKAAFLQAGLRLVTPSHGLCSERDRRLNTELAGADRYQQGSIIYSAGIAPIVFELLNLEFAVERLCPHTQQPWDYRSMTRRGTSAVGGT